MKIKLIVLFLFFLVLAGCAPSRTVIQTDEEETIELNLPPYDGPRKVIYVFELKNKSEFEDPKIGRGVAKMLTTALVNSGRFKVVERSPEMIKSILDEQRFGVSGLVDERTAARVGELLGAEAVFVGEVSEFGIRKTGTYTGFSGTKKITTRIVIDARMINVGTGEIIAAQTGIGKSTTRAKGMGVVLSFEYGTEGFDETTIGIATRKAVYKIVEKFALTNK